MKKSRFDNFIQNNSGETLVEIMVAFIVLMIVIAMFTGVVTSASAAVNNSIDIRRTSDHEYTDLHNELNKEASNVSPAYISPLYQNLAKPAAFTNTAAVTDASDTTISLTAYQYKSGDTVYWVFK